MRNVTWAVFMTWATLGAACGDDDGSTGSGADAGVRADASVQAIDAGPQITACGIVVDLGVGGSAGIPVLFSNPDGTPIETVLTNVSGEASSDACVADTTITALFLEDEPEYSRIYTYAGVQRGDTVHFTYAESSSSSPLFASVNIAIPQDVGEISPEGVSYSIGCNGNGTEGLPDHGVLSDLYRECLGSDDNVDVLATLYDGDVVAYSFLKDVPLTLGTSAEPVENAVELPPWTFGELTGTLTVTGLTQAHRAFHYHVTGVVDGVDFDGDSDESSGPYAGPVTFPLWDALPDGFGEAVKVRGVAWRYSAPAIGQLQTVSMSRSYTRDVTLDIGQTPPPFSGVIATGFGTGTPTLSWIAAPDEDVTFTTLVTYLYVPAWDDAATWVLVVPGSPGTFTLPQIPASYAAYLQLSQVQVAPFRAVVHDTSWTDYHSIITWPGFAPDQVSGASARFDGLPPVPGGDVESTHRTSAWETYY